jgi:hypothetical protein
MVTPFHEGRVVHGDDGKDHVEYDLLVTNVFSAPITLKSVAIVDGAVGELMRVEGTALAEATQSLLDQKPMKEIPASGAAAVEIDLIVTPGTAPDRVSHRIAYDFDVGNLAAPMIGTKEVAGPEVTIDRRRPITILPPVTGVGWGAFNGCCTPNLHRSVRVGAGTRIATPETFAIDWIQVDAEGRFFSGDGKRVEDYPSYGAPIRSVAEGDVVALHDGMGESVPFERNPTLKTPEDFGGNYVLVRIRPDVYAVYAHLQAGSILVKPGDHLAAGAPIGKLGNTGNSTSPHLHFGLLDSPDFLVANSVPFVFDRYKIRAQITGGDNTRLTLAPVSREVTNAHPMMYGIADYE